MVVTRWFAVVLLATVFGLGCGPGKPDTDPTDSELKVPDVDSGDSAVDKNDAPK